MDDAGEISPYFCGFSVASFIVVVYDWGKEKVSTYRGNYWCHIYSPALTFGQEVCFKLRHHWCRHLTKNVFIAWSDLGEHGPISEPSQMVQLNRGRDTVSAGPLWLFCISVYVAYVITQLSHCTDFKYRCATLECYTLCMVASPPS